MKPNWKKLAKEAYERGYAQGVKHALEWTPATSPPTRTGEYMCLRAELKDEKDGIFSPSSVRRSTWTYTANPDGTGAWDKGLSLDCGVLTHWRELPPIPNFGIRIQVVQQEESE